MPSLTNYYISTPGAVTSTVNTVTYGDGGNSTLDHALGNVFSLNANGTSTTIVHDAIPGERYSFELHLQWTAGTITWPTTWTKGDTAPTITGGYVITGVTVDSGVSWKISVLTAPVGIVTDDLVLHLDAGQYDSYPGSGTTWTDLAGSNNGTLTNGPTYDSANGGSIVFDGSNDYVALPNFSTALQAFTFDGWFKVDSIADPYGLFCFGSYIQSGNTWTECYFAAATDLNFRVYNGPASPYFFIQSSDGNISANTWFHVTCVFTNTTDADAQKIYLNGAELVSGTSTTGGLTISNERNTLCARNATGSISIHLNGNCGNAMVYNRALSASEITQNFEATRGRFGI